MPLEGQHLDHYRIERLLGSGGMGEVYLAQDTRITRQVAIKVMRSEEGLEEDARDQKPLRLFQREARAIAGLDHPHILPLYEFGETRLGELDVIYLVMPYRPEGSLTKWLRKQREKRASASQPGALSSPLFTQREIAALIWQAASALHYTHENHIVHQDVKPSNFLVRERTGFLPDLLLCDFGIALLSNATASMSVAVRGTPAYMAPEQWLGQAVSASDQYALAVMAYELLAGRTPFSGASSRIMYSHLHDTPPPASRLCSHRSSIGQ